LIYFFSLSNKEYYIKLEILSLHTFNPIKIYVQVFFNLNSALYLNKDSFKQIFTNHEDDQIMLTRGNNVPQMSCIQTLPTFWFSCVAENNMQYVTYILLCKGTVCDILSSYLCTNIPKQSLLFSCLLLYCAPNFPRPRSLLKSSKRTRPNSTTIAFA